VDEAVAREVLAVLQPLGVQSALEAWDTLQQDQDHKQRALRLALERAQYEAQRIRRQYDAAEPAQITMKLHWVGGSHTTLTIAQNRTGMHRHTTDRQVVDLVRELAKVCPDSAITAILNRLGCRTGAGNSWTESRVRALRYYQEIPVYDPAEPRSWLTLAQVAKVLHVSTNSVRRMICRGILTGKQVVPHAPWVIQQETLQSAAVQEAVRAIHEGRGIPRPDAETAQLPLFQACREV
jgi:hypothetical protein